MTLVKMEYSDGTPMVIMSSFNRLGLPRAIVDARGTNALTYDHAGRLVSSTSLSGPFAGVTVTNHFDGVHGRDQLKVLGLSTEITHDFGYDTYGRLATVGAGDYWASYQYVPNSDLLQTTTCRSNSAPVLTTTRTWEYGMRLYSIANTVDGAIVSSHGYMYDAANRRTRAYLEDCSRWRKRGHISTIDI